MTKWLYGVAAAALLTLGAYQLGRHDESVDQKLRAAGARVVAVEKARETERQDDRSVAKIDARIQQKQADIRANTESIKERIEDYVPETPGTVPPTLPVGVVRLLDAAAQGVPVPAGPLGFDAGTPSPVTYPRLVSVTADNYGSCLADQEALRGWQALWAELEANRAAD